MITWLYAKLWEKSYSGKGAIKYQYHPKPPRKLTHDDTSVHTRPSQLMHERHKTDKYIRLPCIFNEYPENSLYTGEKWCLQEGIKKNRSMKYCITLYSEVDIIIIESVKLDYDVRSIFGYGWHQKEHLL